MRLSPWVLFSSGCLLSGMALLAAGKKSSLPVAPGVELTRYQGKWYEVARLPNRFQRSCRSDVTAEYTLQQNGSIKVVNRCRDAKGQIKQVKGTARPATNGPQTKLKVTFFWPFSGDYWILDLDTDYRWALVGTPDRKYLWVLSRTPALEERIYTSILHKAQELGFDTGAVIRTCQETTGSNPENCGSLNDEHTVPDVDSNGPHRIRLASTT